jgi:glycosyltransferase involved in cell wall biosynthesis
MFRVRKDVDIVHIHGVSSKNVPVTFLARLLGKRIVLTLHTAGQDEPQAVHQRGAAATRAFRAANVVMSVSPVLSRRYEEAGLPVERLRETINGIDTDRFKPATEVERSAIRRELGLPDQPAILFVGFFSRDKRPDVLFDAWLQFARQRQSVPTLLLIGATRSPYFEIDQELAPAMRQAADAAGVGSALRFVEFTNEIERFYRAADVFVLPSVREALPMALLEAMATGLPVIASRLPGATDTIVTDGHDGILVPPGDVAAFRTAIEAVLTDPPRGRQLGAAARSTVTSRFSIDRAAHDWLSVYRELLASA